MKMLALIRYIMLALTLPSIYKSYLQHAMASCSALPAQQCLSVPFVDVRDVIGPLNGPSREYDLHISDIRPQDLPGVISKLMGTQDLCVPVNPAPVWPVKGKLWGINHRVIFTLPVAHGDRVINTHFIFATGAPISFLAK